MPSWWVQPRAEGHGHAITTDAVVKTESERRSMHWAVKLLLTILAACPFAIGYVFIPADALAIVIPQTCVGPFCVTMIVLLTTIFATFLYRRESNGWRRSLLMGVVVGLIASTIITMVGFLYIIWMLSNIQLV